MLRDVEYNKNVKTKIKGSANEFACCASCAAEPSCEAWSWEPPGDAGAAAACHLIWPVEGVSAKKKKGWFAAVRGQARLA